MCINDTRKCYLICISLLIEIKIYFIYYMFVDTSTVSLPSSVLTLLSFE